MLVNIANEQSKLGVNVSVIIIQDVVEGELMSKFLPQVKVICIGKGIGSKRLFFINKINDTLTKINPDIIHLHDTALYDFLNRKWINESVFICATIHALPHGTFGLPWRAGRFIQNYLFHKGGNILCLNRIPYVFTISNAVSQSLLSKYGIKSTVICNGILTNNFKPRENHIPKETFKIVQIGRLQHVIKGQDILVEAISKLNQQGQNVHLTFIGDGESRDYLNQLAERLQAQSFVSFLGAQSQEYVMSHLCEYDLFVQSSRREGFGLTVAEAMAANLPVLVSSGQGPAEVTENDKYGWVFSNGDAEHLKECIQYIINNYDESMVKAKSARNHVRVHYDVSVTAQHYLNAYKGFSLFTD